MGDQSSLKSVQVLLLIFHRHFQFYEGLAKRASHNGHTVDVFAGCLDQVGLQEMKYLPNSTNGIIVFADSFVTSIFRQSFLRMFDKDDEGHLQMGFNATLEVQVRVHRLVKFKR